MLYFLLLASSVMVIFTGLFVLARGNWRKMGLKFAGVCLSTMGGVWLFGAHFVYGPAIFHCSGEVPEAACMTIQLYSIMRNSAFIIFHIAVGRDAMYFRKRERRGLECQKNST